ncbi:MAG: hypothetical protein HZT43_21285 [Exiguobacterium profundum]|nr:MAG: hypothetical protein HZT43_21285 [Exiguobacterium profundum]
MDSDYDPYLGREIFHPQVFYTFGYSWESDLAAALKFESVLGLFANVRDVPAAKLEYEDFLSRSRRRIWQASLIDMKYLDCKGRLFDRHKPQSIIESAKGALPKINAKALLRGCKSLAKTGSRPVAIPACGPKGSLTVFYGKTIIRLIYHWFAWYSERFRSRRLVSFDVFLAYALSNMDTFDKRFPGARHYGLVRDRLSVCH